MKKQLIATIILLQLFSSCVGVKKSKNQIEYKIITPSYDEIYNPNIVNDYIITFSNADWTILEQFVESSPEKGFSLEYVYVKAELTYKNQTWKSVGVRYKGNSSYQKSWDKKSIRVDFEEYVDDNLFYGLKKLTFNNNFNDPSLIRECVSYKLFELTGIKAPKCNHINLYIDKGDGNGPKLHGVFTNVEVVDTRFLKNRYGTEFSGNLYKPELGQGNCGDLACWTEGVSEVQMEKKTNVSDTSFSDIKSFINKLDELYNNGNSDQEKIKADLPIIFDVDNFLKYLAMGNILTNWDSYAGMKHNYYIYNNTLVATNSIGYWEIIPYDLNQSFGGFNLEVSNQESKP